MSLLFVLKLKQEAQKFFRPYLFKHCSFGLDRLSINVVRSSFLCVIYHVRLL